MDGLASFLTAWKIPVGQWGRNFFNYLTDNFEFIFDAIADSLKFLLDSMIDGLLWLPPVILVLAIALLGWWIQKSWKLALGIVLGLFFIINQGLWKETVETLVLVISAAFMSMLIGVPIGIWLAHRPRAYTYVQPILDLMQTMPTFVYLIPVLILFGLGLAPGLLVTIIFASPAPIRLTYLGITSVPRPMVEAGMAFGASKQQLLRKVELPAALPTIMAGLTQCIMLSLSMVVIAALIGANGLGKPVVRALNTVNIPLGLEAGIAIVILAIILDRICRVRIGATS
ncbi:MAG: choline ABC transporter permease subunit [Hoeflea sp.]|uniref:choline ABC transporter permease subunit n=1 Tax=Hoeflea sp. TaxID=1940281 RepID=UPI001D75BCB4|nr:choline ABC transporter permease subunit [Hoeflea sp.]MBU4527315.1 choline ABC transporter permease subunit [Alphaproteobacteria bacterium]MBU4546902.1 choline ABC transporter permease subunit [Alphaproteobacteria bacterium]MBU4551586.1 choline ABC transporter permease subunit [Alphaproteobacteria bacterium]MBV1725591.1 choline ABC transporter permease subunit [Hoeflea sp.]MBV1759639.1 choline ABC transporter permease subunit [Hoeflea sp.]